MKITKIAYENTRDTDGFGNTRIRAEAEIEAWENPEQSLEQLKLPEFHPILGRVGRV